MLIGVGRKTALPWHAFQLPFRQGYLSVAMQDGNFTDFRFRGFDAFVRRRSSPASVRTFWLPTSRPECATLHFNPSLQARRVLGAIGDGRSK